MYAKGKFILSVFVGKVNARDICVCLKCLFVFFLLVTGDKNPKMVI